jgi:hypothetical protein
MNDTINTRIRTVAGVLALLLASMMLLVVAGAQSTDAYEGPFCAEELRNEGEACESVQRSTIRRAIGHTADAYTDVSIEAGGETKGGACRTIECEANTGYLEKDGTGHGFIWNEGPNGARRVDGYLYP